MVGIFGNSQEDRFREKELDDYLDNKYGDNDEGDDYPSLQEDKDMEDYYDKKYDK